jgi:hypothetical protein
VPAQDVAELRLDRQFARCPFLAGDGTDLAAHVLARVPSLAMGDLLASFFTSTKPSHLARRRPDGDVDLAGARRALVS